MPNPSDQPPKNYMIAPKSVPPTEAPLSSGKRYILGITGASGAVYAARLLEQLLIQGHQVHLVVTDFGKRLLADEMNITSVSLSTMCPHLAADQHKALFASNLIIHPNKDVGATIASGSFLHDGMVILPCSSTSLGAIASGSGSNLLSRAAAVTLKERHTLVVCHRESPLNLIDIENMRTLTLAGAIIAPTNPGLYLLPTTVDELIDFTVGKALDLLKVPHALKTRWAE
ncbi:MAG: UbiX family flavin prenyltransferase [Phycisphaerales bacterium]|nr:UbiX family flavin prenyltransferase [Phycisphaerales bacterium]